MTREELDTLWFKAMHESIKDGEDFIRYHFAALVAAAEREACAKLCEETARHNEEVGCDIDLLIGNMECAAAIRARGET
jgi:hypothetical protein